MFLFLPQTRTPTHTHKHTRPFVCTRSHVHALFHHMIVATTIITICILYQQKKESLKSFDPLFGPKNFFLCSEDSVRYRLTFRTRCVCVYIAFIVHYPDLHFLFQE